MIVALEQAQQAIQAKNHPFGACLVEDSGNVLMTAQNSVVTDNDPTCHAELNLVRKACASLSKDQLKRATVVTSTEPCPMCSGAIYWAGIGRVVYACSGEELGVISGEELAVPCSTVFNSGRLHRVEVEGPVLREEAVAMHTKFWASWGGGHFGKDEEVSQDASWKINY